MSKPHTRSTHHNESLCFFWYTRHQTLASPNLANLLCHLPPLFATMNKAAMYATIPYHNKRSIANLPHQSLSPPLECDLTEIRDLMIHDFRAINTSFEQLRAETDNQMEALGVQVNT
ncbi:uncharacterized protein G2W53_016228 [Senna tora]|uniref:Uncharacterized protein n=1 Tax=Senna tora TaxID=362788 RepID=A0A834WQ16_9FABA|nr:uncharacterized protein G2W53_016228 [Senna tora]